MLLRNNQKSFISESKQRFSIRKLSIGAASVLLGMSFIGMTQTVKAADNNPAVQKSEPVKETPNVDLLGGSHI